MRNVAAQFRPVLVMGGQFFDPEESALGERSVHTRPSMPLAQYESIPLRPSWVGGIHREHRAVQDGDDVGHRQHGANMRAPALAGHPQGVQTDASRQLSSVGHSRLMRLSHRRTGVCTRSRNRRHREKP